MTAFEFSKHAVAVCSRYSFIRSIEILLLDEPMVKIKAVLDSSTTLHIFFNADSSKYSFALIKSDKRIFGVDNSQGWHIHPFEAPQSHQETTETSLSEFLDILDRHKRSLLS